MCTYLVPSSSLEMETLLAVVGGCAASSRLSDEMVRIDDQRLAAVVVPVSWQFDVS